LKLPAERRVPLLRQICGFNANTLTLPQIVLNNEELTFTFSTPLSLADPMKLYGVIYEICINGDSYDDEFVSKFGAVPLREKEVTYLPEQEVEKAWKLYHAFLDEAMRYDEFFNAKRWYGYCYDIMGIELMKMDYIIAPQGYLRTLLERSVFALWAHRPMEEVIANLRKDVGMYKDRGREEFAQDFYQSEFFIHAKKTAEIQACQNAMGERYDWSNKDISRRNHLGVSLNYLFASYHLMYSYFIPPKLQKEIQATLAAMSGKPWEQASEIAWSSFKKIMDPAFAE
jgi:hypothetical protein